MNGSATSTSNYVPILFVVGAVVCMLGSMVTEEYTQLLHVAAYALITLYYATQAMRHDGMSFLMKMLAALLVTLAYIARLINEDAPALLVAAALIFFLASVWSPADTSKAFSAVGATCFLANVLLTHFARDKEFSDERFTIMAGMVCLLVASVHHSLTH